LLATHPQGKLVLSGGTTGPEGSILIVGVLAVACLLIRFTLPKASYYDAPALPEPAAAPGPSLPTEPTPPPANATA